MNNRLRKWELSLLIALCVSFCLGTWAQAKQENIAGSLVRLHVIAVSDDEEEQRIKLNVRDSVLRYLSPKLGDAADSDEARRIIRSELDGIFAAASESACGRRVQVTLGEEYYPTKSYGSFSLPAGKYQSLRIILGDGEGHNWWCVVFPPLCVSAAETQSALDTMSDDVRGIVSDDGYTVKFRVVELWGELLKLVGAER